MGFGDWRPIKTAPKDGTRILAWCPDEKTVLSVYWDKSFRFVFDEAKAAKSVRYQGEHDGAWTDNAVLSFGYEETKSYFPTHWMPHPPPPKQ